MALLVRLTQWFFFMHVHVLSAPGALAHRILVITPFNTNMANICWQHQTLTACCFNCDQSSFSSSGKDFKAFHNIFYMSLLFTWQDASYLSYLNHDVYEQSDGNKRIAALSLVISFHGGPRSSAITGTKALTTQRMLQFVNMIFIHFKIGLWQSSV